MSRAFSAFLVWSFCLSIGCSVLTLARSGSVACCCICSRARRTSLNGCCITAGSCCISCSCWSRAACFFSISLMMVVVAVELLVSVFDFSSFWPVRFMIVMLAMMIDKILATVAIVFWKAERPVLICCLVGFFRWFCLIFYYYENSFPCLQESPFKISMISYLSLYVFYLKMSFKKSNFYLWKRTQKIAV